MIVKTWSIIDLQEMVMWKYSIWASTWAMDRCFPKLLSPVVACLRHKTKKEVGQFLELVVYYRRFVSNFWMWRRIQPPEWPARSHQHIQTHIYTPQNMNFLWTKQSKSCKSRTHFMVLCHFCWVLFELCLPPKPSFTLLHTDVHQTYITVRENQSYMFIFHFLCVGKW